MILDPEQELINHLANPSSAEQIIKEGITDDLLVTPQAKSVLSFTRHYFGKSGQFPTPQVLATEFSELSFAQPASAVQWVLDTLRMRYKRSEVSELVMNLAHLSENPDKALTVMRSKSMEIERNVLSSSHIWSLKEYPLFIKQIQDEILNTNSFDKFSTGFYEVDQFTGSIRPGQLAFWAARPKRMKTFFLLQAFLEQIKQGNKPIFFTLELSVKEIMLRLMCLISQYPWDKAQRGDFGVPGAWKQIEESWKFFTDTYGDAIVIQPVRDERNVPSLLLQADRHQANSIFISQLRYVTPLRTYRQTHDAHAEVVFDLKQAASAPGTERPILVEAQFNREAQKISELQELDLAQLGLTDAIGQAADVVYALTQGEKERDNKLIEFGILEARNHGKKSWWIEYDYINTTHLSYYSSVTKTPSP